MEVNKEIVNMTSTFNSKESRSNAKNVLSPQMVMNNVFFLINLQQFFVVQEIFKKLMLIVGGIFPHFSNYLLNF